MPTTFYGKWSLQVIGNVGEFAQRVRIQGSLNADGNLNAALGAQIAEIDGAAWIVRLERSDTAVRMLLPRAVYLSAAHAQGPAPRLL